MRKGFSTILIVALLAVVVFVILVIGAKGVIFPIGKQAIAPNVQTFDGCVQQGGIILESYPRQCKSKDLKSLLKTFQP